ncbi:MAG: hypothetical protein R3D98_07195 [Candidatus Krumholzibacteriia bacterium]
MRHPRRIRRLLGVAATLVVLGGLAGLGSVRPAVAQPTSDPESWVPVTIIFSSDIKGHIEPCG